MARAKPFDDLPRTLEAFERWHARQPERWEFIDGHPVMKAPPALRHTRIKGNLFAALHGSLRGRDCSGYVDGAEIKSERTSSIPDIVVTCGPVDLRGSTITEPVVIVEVLSPSTEKADRGSKWRAYRLIPSLRHYLIVAQDRMLVELHTRKAPSVFEERSVEEGELHLDAIGAVLHLDAIYAGVSFEEEAEGAEKEVEDGEAGDEQTAGESGEGRA